MYSTSFAVAHPKAAPAAAPTKAPFQLPPIAAPLAAPTTAPASDPRSWPFAPWLAQPAARAAQSVILSVFDLVFMFISLIYASVIIARIPPRDLNYRHQHGGQHPSIERVSHSPFGLSSAFDWVEANALSEYPMADRPG
ncbi:protein of unknown function [Methylocaldum szegediense]|uniref:Uncharacterized protein n=1 Tax=Methylocaldum szegediense TaxID=73780 RepID=A0ABM9I390_9GAMM|nr:protein of unknown function [Methylocaldum szegediense]